jgi:hypothetical protein
MEVNYVHKDSTTLVQDELVKNELNQIELQYNALEQQKFNELLKENEELKKKLEERTKMYQNAYKYGQRMEDVTITLKAEQKEFIKDLEGYLNLFDYDQISCDMIEEILQKYKSIIGE